MHKKSAGLLAFRKKGDSVEIFLAHPGGPFWKNKDRGVWSIPKGEFEEEAPLAAAIREFGEETGVEASGNFLELTPVKQKNGKTVFAWAFEQDIDAAKIVSNNFELEWPPRSGKKTLFPEIDKAAWFSADDALGKIIPAQAAFITELLHHLKIN